jgi:hypothetical protein
MTGRRIRSILLAAAVALAATPASADDCDPNPPPPVAAGPDGPILWATSGSQSASGTCTQYITSGVGAGRTRGLICPNRQVHPPHGVFIPPMGVVQGWNSCGDAYGGNCP